jgi:hypothetical protein
LLEDFGRIFSRPKTIEHSLGNNPVLLLISLGQLKKMESIY